MRLDNQSILSDAQPVVANTPTVSTNVLDLGDTITTAYSKKKLTHQIGLGNMSPLLIQLVEAIAGDDVSGLRVEVQESALEDFTGPTTRVVSATEIFTADESIPAGTIVPLQALPRGITQRFIRLRYQVLSAATPATPADSGAITAGFVDAIDGIRR